MALSDVLARHAQGHSAGSVLAERLAEMGHVMGEGGTRTAWMQLSPVTDARGEYVRDLKKEDFQLFEDGKPQPITNFLPIDIPIERGERDPKTSQVLGMLKILGLHVRDLPKLLKALGRDYRLQRP